MERITSWPPERVKTGIRGSLLLSHRIFDTTTQVGNVVPFHPGTEEKESLVNGGKRLWP
jgi:hypothetical protein